MLLLHAEHSCASRHVSIQVVLPMQPLLLNAVDDHGETKHCFCTPDQRHMNLEQFIAFFRHSQNNSSAAEVPYLQVGWLLSATKSMDTTYLACAA